MPLIATLTAELKRRLPAGSLRGRLAAGTFWAALGAVVSQGLGLLASVIVARIIGRESFGELMVVLSTAGMFGVFAGLALGTTATKYVAEFRTTSPERAGRTLTLSAVMAVASGGLISAAMYAAAPFLADRALDAPQLANEIRICCGVLFFSALNGAQTGALAGLEAWKTMAVANLIRGLLNFPALLAGAWWWGLPGAVAAYSAVAGAGWLITHVALRYELKRSGLGFNFSGLGEEAPILWRFSLPGVLSGAMVTPARWAANALMAHHPQGYSELGIFNAAYQWNNALIFLPGVLGQVVTPIMANALGLDQARSAKKLMLAAIGVNLVLALGPSLVIGVASPWVMRQYGEGFEAGWPSLLVCLAVAALWSAQTPVGKALAAAGRMWIGFAMNLVWAVVLLGSIYVLLDYGAMGMALGHLIAYLALGVLTFWYAYARVLAPKVETAAPAPRGGD